MKAMQWMQVVAISSSLALVGTAIACDTDQTSSPSNEPAPGAVSGNSPAQLGDDLRSNSSAQLGNDSPSATVPNAADALAPNAQRSQVDRVNVTFGRGVPPFDAGQSTAWVSGIKYRFAQDVAVRRTRNIGTRARERNGPRQVGRFFFCRSPARVARTPEASSPARMSFTSAHRLGVFP